MDVLISAFLQDGDGSPSGFAKLLDIFFETKDIRVVRLYDALLQNIVVCILVSRYVVVLTLVPLANIVSHNLQCPVPIEHLFPFCVEGGVFFKTVRSKRREDLNAVFVIDSHDKNYSAAKATFLIFAYAPAT